MFDLLGVEYSSESASDLDYDPFREKSRKKKGKKSSSSNSASNSKKSSSTNKKNRKNEDDVISRRTRAKITLDDSVFDENERLLMMAEPEVAKDDDWKEGNDDASHVSTESDSEYEKLVRFVREGGDGGGLGEEEEENDEDYVAEEVENEEEEEDDEEEDNADAEHRENTVVIPQQEVSELLQDALQAQIQPLGIESNYSRGGSSNNNDEDEEEYQWADDVNGLQDPFQRSSLPLSADRAMIVRDGRQPLFTDELRRRLREQREVLLDLACDLYVRSAHIPSHSACAERCHHVLSEIFRFFEISNSFYLMRKRAFLGLNTLPTGLRLVVEDKWRIEMEREQQTLPPAVTHLYIKGVEFVPDALKAVYTASSASDQNVQSALQAVKRRLRDEDKQQQQQQQGADGGNGTRSDTRREFHDDGDDNPNDGDERERQNQQQSSREVDLRTKNRLLDYDSWVPFPPKSERSKFTNAEDELFVIGLERYGKNFEAIHQFVLPTKDTKTLFLRYKNQTSKNSARNPIKNWKLKSKSHPDISFAHSNNINSNHPLSSKSSNAPSSSAPAMDKTSSASNNSNNKRQGGERRNSNNNNSARSVTFEQEIIDSSGEENN